MSEGRQLNLFSPSLNPVSRLKAAMRQAIKGGRYSREQICERMDKLASSEGLRTGRSDRISLATLDAWVAESKTGHVIPLELLPAFCMASESMLPMQVMAASVGMQVIDERDAKILTLAKMEIETKKLARQKRRLQREIEEDYHV